MSSMHNPLTSYGCLLINVFSFFPFFVGDKFHSFCTASVNCPPTIDHNDAGQAVFCLRGSAFSQTIAMVTFAFRPKVSPWLRFSSWNGPLSASSWSLKTLFFIFHAWRVQCPHWSHTVHRMRIVVASALSPQKIKVVKSPQSSKPGWPCFFRFFQWKIFFF